MFSHDDQYQGFNIVSHTATSRAASLAHSQQPNMLDPSTESQLRVLQRQYFQLVEPNQLRWPGDDVLKSSDVQTWIFGHMFDTENIKFPPPDRYQLRILKFLISKLERSIVDPEEDVRPPLSSTSVHLCSPCCSIYAYRCAVYIFDVKLHLISN